MQKVMTNSALTYSLLADPRERRRSQEFDQQKIRAFPGLYEYLLILISYWSIPRLLLLSLASTERLYIRAEFAISLCTEKGILNTTEIAVCNLSEFYWCSIFLKSLTPKSIGQRKLSKSSKVLMGQCSSKSPLLIIINRSLKIQSLKARTNKNSQILEGIHRLPWKKPLV